MNQTRSFLLSKVFEAGGICLVLLSLVVFIDHANAECSNCRVADSTCLRMAPDPITGCNLGICGQYNPFTCAGDCDCVVDPLIAGACKCKS